MRSFQILRRCFASQQFWTLPTSANLKCSANNPEKCAELVSSDLSSSNQTKTWNQQQYPISSSLSSDSSTTMSTSESDNSKNRNRRYVIDAHLHVWSDPQESESDYPWANPSAVPDDLKNLRINNDSYAVTYQTFHNLAKKGNVRGALIVQPATHMFDHSYVDEAIEKTLNQDDGGTKFFRGMFLANSKLPSIEEALIDLKNKKDAGYVGVRFNPGLFPTVNTENSENSLTSTSVTNTSPLSSEMARQLYKKCGELDLPVGIMTFTGLLPHIQAIKDLLTEYPKTKLILDHFGFYRQPATGGIAEEEESSGNIEEPIQLPSWSNNLFEKSSEASRICLSSNNNEESFQALLDLHTFPQVYIKLSAFFRVSKQAFPHKDVRPRVIALIKKFGSNRLIYGSDFPFVLLGGHAKNSFAVNEYGDSATIFDRWNDDLIESGSDEKNDLLISDEDINNILANTAIELFKFDAKGI